MDVFHSRSLEHFLEVPPLLLSAHFSKELSMMSAEEVYIGSKLKSSEKIPTLFVYARPQGKSLTTVYSGPLFMANRTCKCMEKRNDFGTSCVTIFLLT